MSEPVHGAACPPWVQTFKRRYAEGVANVFLLHWNVADYVQANLDLRTYLAMVLASRPIVAYYNRAEGITFGTGEGARQAREQFVEAVGLNASTSDLAALAAITGAPAGGEVPLPRDPSAALPLLEKLLRQSDTKAAVVIDYVETIAPAADMAAMSPEDRSILVHLQRWARDPEIAAAGHPVLLIAANLTDVHPALRAASSRISAIEVPLPDAVERLEYIERLAGAGMELVDGFTAQEFARTTAGLSRIHLEDIHLSAQFAGVPVDRTYVKDRKREIVASEFAEVIELLDPELTFADIGGHAHVKRFLTRSVIEPIRTGNASRCPMGILLLGPAGTGKSVMAQALAREAGVNCVVLNLARIFGAYVGESERNLEKALKCIESMSPTIVFIDEIDQAVRRQQGGGDSGVSARVFKRLLEFMGDGGHRGRVVFLAATNRPDLVDAALKRPGRFDKKVPFLVPEAEDRAQILEVMTRRYLGDRINAAALSVVLPRTDGWTGAELEALTIKAGELLADGEVRDLREALPLALDRYRPTTADIELMTLLAIAEVNDTDLLPPAYRDKLQNRAALEAEIQTKRPPAAAGRGPREL